MIDITNRTDFIETWLTEMPMGLGSFPTFDQVEYTIKDRIKAGSKVIDVSPNIKKIVGQQVIYYWVEIKGEIALGVELQIRPQALVVSVIGKNRKYVNKPPYASDLYNSILQDSGKSIRLISDLSLSDEGYDIWKRLFKQGHKISVYDRAEPGKTFTTLNSIEEMDKYFAMDDTDYKRYQYVLSEMGEVLAETRSYFNTRRYRELVPGLL
jgi:hypothetical protein